jgi:hypothetical protein
MDVWPGAATKALFFTSNPIRFSLATSGLIMGPLIDILKA